MSDASLSHRFGTRTAVARLALAAFALSLGGCVTGEEFDSYSPRYSQAQISGAGGRSTSVLMPDSCSLPASAQATGMLPSGCSNAYNLQRMVENERDLVQGRRLGPAPAAPATRAARSYLNGAVPAPAAEGALSPQPAR